MTPLLTSNRLTMDNSDWLSCSS